MTTLVTGAAGLTPAVTMRELARRGEDVVGLDVASPAEGSGGFPMVEASITDLERLKSLIRRQGVDRVVHMAALHGPECEQDPHRGMMINVWGTDVVLEAARLTGVKRVVLASSIAVYGPQRLYGPDYVGEETATRPTIVYGAAKAMNEFMAARYQARYGLETVAVRLSIVIGPGRRRNADRMWPSDFASRPALGQPVEIPLSGDEECSLIHVEDAARLFAELALAPRVAWPTCLSGGYVLRLKELVPVVRRWLPQARITFAAVEPGQLQYPSRLDARRAREEFDFVLPPLERRVLDHINETRTAAGLPSIEG